MKVYWMDIGWMLKPHQARQATNLNKQQAFKDLGISFNNQNVVMRNNNVKF
jgi:hypothetical protein